MINMFLPEDYIIESSRCVLRIISLADLPHVFSASRYPGFNDGMVWDPPEKEEDLREFHFTCIKAWQEGSAYTFTIEDKLTQDFIGRVSIRSQEQNFWNLGFWTHPEYQNRGYMTEAVRSIINFGFNVLGAQQIFASHALWNTASETVIKKCGLKFHSLKPEGYRKNNNWITVNQLSISRPEWLSRIK